MKDNIMKSLNQRIGNFKKILQKNNILSVPNIIENGYVKLIHEDGNVRYSTPDLERSTFWGESITTENGFVKLTYKYGNVRYYTSDLKYYISRGEYKSITTENDLIKIVYLNGIIRHFTFDLDIEKEKNNSLEIEESASTSPFQPQPK